jgi:putative heme iron utilization protein
MQAEVVASIRSLLQTERVLSLAVVVDGEVEAGLLPYAVSDDHTALYVQASGLARHARGMQPGSQVGLLVHAADTAERDAAERFTARFPASAMTLDLADFNLYELRLGRGRYIEGFARAFNVGPETFGGL